MDHMYAHAMPQSWTEADARHATSTRVAGEDLRRRILTRAVEIAVIPELLRRYRVTPGSLVIVRAQVQELAGLVLNDDERAAIAYITRLQVQGAATDTLCLDLLAPAARALGTMWEDDACDFTQVTIGLARLQSAMRALAPIEIVPKTAAPRVVLVPLPGETHSFGLSMVYEFFRRAGWNAWTGSVDSPAALRTLVASRSIAVLGFSMACDERMAEARTQIAAVRRASLNPAIAIMVGGPGFTADPTLAAAVGADATATDGHNAVLQATALLAQAERRIGRVKEGRSRP